jgi:hypothetical protein
VSTNFILKHWCFVVDYARLYHERLFANPICAIIILSLSKKNKDEGISLVGYRRYCYTTALRDVCNNYNNELKQATFLRTRTASNVKRQGQECWLVDNVKFASGQRSCCQKRRLLKLASNLRTPRTHIKRKGASVLSN